MKDVVEPYSVWQNTFTYTVATCVCRDWLGAGYKFARRNGFILYFFTRKRAQAYADKLNGVA